MVRDITMAMLSNVLETVSASVYHGPGDWDTLLDKKYPPTSKVFPLPKYTHI